MPVRSESELLQEKLDACVAKLRKSEQQLADTQRVAHLGSWECEIGAGKVRWSEETYRIFGLDPDQVPASDEGFIGRVHLDDRERVKAALRQAPQEGIHNLQFRIIRPDGSLRLVVGNGEVVHDTAGRPVSLIGTCHDVTEYHMAKEALGESEQRFSKIFQAAPALVSITTVAEGIHLEVNAAFLKTLRYERGEVIGRSGLELDLWVDPADRGKIVQALLEKREVREHEVLLRGKTGALIAGLLSAELINIKGKQFLVTLVNDITERKRAQEEQARLAAIVQSSDDAIVGKTLDGIIVDWNRGAEMLYGYRASEVIGRHIRMLFPPGASDSFEDVLEKLRRGERVEHYETERITKDGRILAVSSCISPIFDGNGRITGAATITRDITAHKQAKEQINLLVTRLAARTHELEAVIPELEAFNYTVSHDLRTPITVISGYCNWLRSECFPSSEEPCSVYLDEIHQAAERMSSLIDTLLDFSRLSRADLTREPVDLTTFAREIVATLQVAEPQRRVRVEIADGVVVKGDAAMLRVMLENLLGNAWKFTSTREEAVIEFGVTTVEGLRACYVRDNGEGFGMADAERLFSPFGRLSGAKSYQGFGIGLATVKRIVSRHGGKVWGVGEKGKGAVFYFTL
ncbi:PAS domain S-box protein [Geomonas sp. RF6]|uniref:PAS domain-containing sensor histidine kinase n=1 Tax=Geomonas sp. RF6 TaxID=2897342 RepID=UPI001E2D38FF|nr:PAS domain S-box protein [Geomonas sp. RF6]UFS68906.1 PAS domain S-box protein [Geomonas sp. RF6]